jgi:hypothetical protein
MLRTAPPVERANDLQRELLLQQRHSGEQVQSKQDDGAAEARSLGMSLHRGRMWVLLYSAI